MRSDLLTTKITLCYLDATDTRKALLLRLDVNAILVGPEVLVTQIKSYGFVRNEILTFLGSQENKGSRKRRLLLVSTNHFYYLQCCKYSSAIKATRSQ